MALRLSGWARLWIVILLPIWIATTWLSVTAESDRWRSACNWNGCSNYFVSPVEDRVRAGNWPGTPVEPSLEEVRAEVTRREQATTFHNNRMLSAYTSPAIGVLIAFLLAMIAKSAALWVWRGFRKQD